MQALQQGPLHIRSLLLQVAMPGVSGTVALRTARYAARRCPSRERARRPEAFGLLHPVLGRAAEADLPLGVRRRAKIRARIKETNAPAPDSVAPAFIVQRLGRGVLAGGGGAVVVAGRGGGVVAGGGGAAVVAGTVGDGGADADVALQYMA